jgi:hypothetical protein
MTIAALQRGRETVGLARYAERISGDVMACGNIAFFPGSPAAAHPAFARWLRSRDQVVEGDVVAGVIERMRWQLPESPQAASARRAARDAYPMVMQRLIGGTHGEVMLALEGPSRGKTQGARKLVQRELGRA